MKLDQMRKMSKASKTATVLIALVAWAVAVVPGFAADYAAFHMQVDAAVQAGDTVTVTTTGAQ